jgi:hypothetical protein
MIGRSALMIVETDPADWMATGSAYPETTFTQTRLNVYRCAGLAPYVGQPFIYVWEVAADDRGRWIAGPSRTQEPYGFDEDSYWTPVMRAISNRTELDYIWRHHDTGKEPQS